MSKEQDEWIRTMRELAELIWKTLLGDTKEVLNQRQQEAPLNRSNKPDLTPAPDTDLLKNSNLTNKEKQSLLPNHEEINDDNDEERRNNLEM